MHDMGRGGNITPIDLMLASFFSNLALLSNGRAGNKARLGRGLAWLGLALAVLPYASGVMA